MAPLPNEHSGVQISALGMGKLAAMPIVEILALPSHAKGRHLEPLRNIRYSQRGENSVSHRRRSLSQDFIIVNTKVSIRKSELIHRWCQTRNWTIINLLCMGRSPSHLLTLILQSKRFIVLSGDADLKGLLFEGTFRIFSFSDSRNTFAFHVRKSIDDIFGQESDLRWRYYLCAKPKIVMTGLYGT
jgi:hypothetical protein